ncbi:MAG: hypothetical protein AAGA23_15850 [Pseudomonadota bacterium]
MPTYDYACPANGQVFEVMHRMSDSISTWAELCALTGEQVGDTPPDSPVQKKLGAVAVATPKIGERKKNPGKAKAAPAKKHGAGCGCC